MNRRIKLACRLVFLLIIVCQQTAISQLCQGSLGDPVVKITFGSGANPGPPLKAGITNYIYQNVDCPNDGYYAVRNSSGPCFFNSWHYMQADHTGDPNGYFMQINASIQPNNFYVDTVKGLCPGTTFEFAAWVTNLMLPSACNGNGIKPNITFSIEKTDGTVIASYNTGNINSVYFAAAWQQYGFFFTTPTGISDVVLRMKNNAPGGCGNDVALDDITFRPCGPTIQIGIPGSTNTSKDICAGQGLPLTLTSNISSGYNNPVYQWQKSSDGIIWTDIPFETNTSYSTIIASNAPNGSYNFRLSISEKSNLGIAGCKINSNNFSVNVTPYPTINIIANTPVCESGTLELQGPSGNLCIWTGPLGFLDTSYDAFIRNVKFANAGKYYITATSPAGCATSDSIQITVTPKITASVRSDTTICQGKSVNLQGQGTGSYAWTPLSGLSSASVANPLASPIIPTRYLLTLTKGGCIDTASVFINESLNPVAHAGPDKEMIQGNSVILEGDTAGSNINYFWTPNMYIDNNLLLKPTVSPVQDITYTFNVVSNSGCGIATDNVFVRVFNKITVPNAFSPNNDGINDVWNIPLLNTYPNATVIVFDRYGKIIFESTGYPKPWNGAINGKPVPAGTYYYVIDTHSPMPKLTGWVFILR